VFLDGRCSCLAEQVVLTHNETDDHNGKGDGIETSFYNATRGEKRKEGSIIFQFGFSVFLSLEVLCLI
jgi:hypothetical protein